MCLLLGFTSHAQDKPNKPAEKVAAETPEVVELTKEQTAKITALQKELETASLRAENLQLKIKDAQSQLEKFQKAAEDAQKAVANEIVTVTKLTATQLQEYNGEEKDGKLILRKRKKE